MMANVSHEFNNVITIIGELSGLLQDLSALAARSGEASPPPPEKLDLIAGKIKQQTARGKALITNMNRFAHCVDDPEQAVELAAVVDNMAALSQRLLERQETRLDWTVPPDAPDLTCDAFLLRRALLAGWECAARLAIEPPQIELTLEPGAKATTLVIAGQARMDEAEPVAGWDELTEIGRRLGGRIGRVHSDDRFAIRIEVPAGGNVTG